MLGAKPSLRRLAIGVAFLLVVGGGLLGYLRQETVAPAESSQTDVERASHLLDEDGVPFLQIAGVGRQRHPAWIALYALAYAGIEVYDPRLAGQRDEARFNAAIKWLEANLRQQGNGLWTWQYGFDSTYNDLSIEAPWSSAFAQAVGIQAFLAAHRKTGDDRYLELATKAAQSLFTPLQEGGFLFQSGEDVWFEEIPVPAGNPGHILNGHMRVLLALGELAEATGSVSVQAWLQRGLDTLYRWLPRFDTGYWLRYDLNPRKADLLFRIANPYGVAAHALAVDRIVLRDPATGGESTIDVGSDADATGPNRIAGVHWGQIETIENRGARRLLPVALEPDHGQMVAPHSYFYLSLPGEWRDNLRDQWYELVIEYFDDAPANLTIQQRSIAPGPAFRDMRDGDLHLTGSGRWRKWIVPVRPTDLGYWVGESYAEKHAEYLVQLARRDRRLEQWSRAARGYVRGIAPASDMGEEVSPPPLELPTQTPMLPLYSLDGRGVLRQYRAPLPTTGRKDARLDAAGVEGEPVYSPFLVARQLTDDPEFREYIGRNMVRRQASPGSPEPRPALAWLLDARNFESVAGANVYFYAFDNVYNATVSKAPWPSAFGQAHVLGALVHAARQGIGDPDEVREAIRRTAAAFAIPLQEGGVLARDPGGAVWYEEVPNGTHILNAHLVSIEELHRAAQALRSPAVENMADAGIRSAREHLHLFDTGYWLRYDLVPAREVLLQVDWLEGETSPLIDEVLLEDPLCGCHVRLDVGADGDGGGGLESGVRITGSEWQQATKVDGRSVRAFSNGRALRTTPSPGGTRHNVYIALQPPSPTSSGLFEVPSLRLVIRYKDVSSGRFTIKSRAIDRGDVLAFEPLRGPAWSQSGDQEWKEAVFMIRPQDMGWYKGDAYQKYEVERLESIAELTGDWFFRQYAKRHRHLLELHQQGSSAIRPGLTTGERPLIASQIRPAPRTGEALDPNDSIAWLPPYDPSAWSGNAIGHGFSISRRAHDRAKGSS